MSLCADFEFRVTHSTAGLGERGRVVVIGRDPRDALVSSYFYAVKLSVGEAVILLRPPLHLADVLTGIEKGCHYNDSLADG